MCVGANVVAAQKNVQEEVKQNQYQGEEEEQDEKMFEGDRSRWYTDTVLNAELADYAPVKGCMVIRPYGYALWENINGATCRCCSTSGPTWCAGKCAPGSSCAPANSSGRRATPLTPLRDGKALQAGTSHFLGQNFAKAFDIKFQSQAGELEYAWQTSWGVSTRLIGAVVLGHGDDKGLVLPPRIAPIQVVIVPIYKTDEEKALVLGRCNEIFAELKKAGIRVHLDDRDNCTPGFKFNHWELRGVPLRLNIGPRDVAGNVVEIARRDTSEKIRGVAQAGLVNELTGLLSAVQKNIFDKALAFRQSKTVKAASYDELKKILSESNVFVECHWDGSSEDEGKIKEETKATIRAIPFAFEPVQGTCMYTGKPTTRRVIFARSY
jgi:prolyl-tRNA synthetase family I